MAGPPYDPVLMFKVLVLQALCNLSDDQAEFQIRDRLSFMRFLGLNPSMPSPDAKTIWLLREHLVHRRQALPGHVINHVEHPEPSARSHLVVNEFQAPAPCPSSEHLAQLAA